MFTFIVRQAPDIDHFSPVAYKLAASGERVSILCQNAGYDLKSDYRLTFLQENFGVLVRHIYAIPAGFHRRWLEGYLRYWSARFSRNPKRLQQFRGPQLVQWFDRTWARSLLGRLGTRVLIMEVQSAGKLILRPYSDERLVVTPLAEAARDLGIPIVKLPHGHKMRREPPGTIGEAEEQILRNPTGDLSLPQCRQLIEMYRRRWAPGQPLIVAGCARYNEEWRNLNLELLRTRYSLDGLPDGSGRLKVLCFGRGKVKFTPASPAAAAIRSLPFADVLFSDRPRPQEGPPRGASLPMARLVDWADVTLVSASSAALEALGQGKTLLYLKYLDPSESTLYEEYGVCWTISSEEELLAALRQLHENPGFHPYSVGAVQRFLADMTSRGDPSYPVLDGFVRILREVAQGRIPEEDIGEAGEPADQFHQTHPACCPPCNDR